MADRKMATRDTKRRVELITKKISDLKDYAWSIPSLFVYATPWTGGLCVVGDDRLRLCSIVRAHKDEFLENLKLKIQYYQNAISGAECFTI